MKKEQHAYIVSKTRGVINVRTAELVNMATFIKPLLSVRIPWYVLLAILAVCNERDGPGDEAIITLYE